jgi:integrase
MSRNAKPWYNSERDCWMAYVNGRKVRLADGKTNRKGAQARLNELRFQAQLNPSPAGPEQTVASVIESYLLQAEQTLSPTTLAMRTPYLQSFSEVHGWRHVEDCLPDHLAQWVAKHKGWVSDWTKCGAIRNVQVAFNWAAKKRVAGGRFLIRENPFKGVSHRVGPPRREMTEQEFRAILRHTGAPFWHKPTPGARFRRVLLFLWLTGARPSEAAKLTWKNVHFDQHVVVLAEHKTSRTQKSFAPRVIPLVPVLEKLLHWIQRQNEGERVFLNHRRKPWTKDSLAQRVRRAREAAGISDEVTLYCARHAFGCRGIVNGCDIKTLSALMGHTTVRMTEHYIHLANQHQHLVAAMRLVSGG